MYDKRDKTQNHISYALQIGELGGGQTEGPSRYFTKVQLLTSTGKQTSPTTIHEKYSDIYF
jgi:hypothetical protein